MFKLLTPALDADDGFLGLNSKLDVDLVTVSLRSSKMLTMGVELVSDGDDVDWGMAGISNFVCKYRMIDDLPLAMLPSTAI